MQRIFAIVLGAGGLWLLVLVAQGRLILASAAVGLTSVGAAVGLWTGATWGRLLGAATVTVLALSSIATEVAQEKPIGAGRLGLAAVCLAAAWSIFRSRPAAPPPDA